MDRRLAMLKADREFGTGADTRFRSRDLQMRTVILSGRASS